MKHVQHLLAMGHMTNKAELSGRFKRVWDLGWEHPDQYGPLLAHFKNGVELLMEFDEESNLALAELTKPFDDLDDAHAWADEVVTHLFDNDLVMDGFAYPKPFRRTALKMASIVSWGAWVVNEVEALQVLVVRSSSPTEIWYASLSVHIKPTADPRPGDESSTTSTAWEEFDNSPAPTILRVVAGLDVDVLQANLQPDTENAGA